MSRRTVLTLAAIALVAAACAWALRTNPEQPRAASGARAWAKRLVHPGLENFAEVAPGIYRGAQPTPDGYRKLKELGVKTVITLRSLHEEREAVLAAGLEPVEIPLVADVRGSRPPSSEDVARFLSVVLDPAKRPVYFHCAFGQDRTGTMCAVYRMEVDGWTPEEAFEEMQGFGFNDIWTDLSAFVKSYRRTRKHDAAAVGSR